MFRSVNRCDVSRLEPTSFQVSGTDTGARGLARTQTTWVTMPTTFLTFTRWVPRGQLGAGVFMVEA